MVGVIEILRFLLCCVERRGEEEDNRYQGFPDLIQSLITSTETLPSSSSYYSSEPRISSSSSGPRTYLSSPQGQGQGQGQGHPYTSTSPKPYSYTPPLRNNNIIPPTPTRWPVVVIPTSSTSSTTNLSQSNSATPSLPSTNLSRCRPVVIQSNSATPSKSPTPAHAQPSLPSTSANLPRCLQSNSTPITKPQHRSTPSKDKGSLKPTPFSSLGSSSSLHQSLPTKASLPSNILPTPSIKPSPLSSLGSSSSLQQSIPYKGKYVRDEKGSTSFLYSAPDDIKRLLQKDIVPQVLQNPLTPSTYDKYFAALLYAEDIYIEKWSDYSLHSVTLELHKAAIYAKSNRNKNLIVDGEEDDKLFVAFRIDSIPEKRPFLLSRDFVLLQPLNKTAEPFRGILYRVVKGNLVLAEFGDDFHRQHSSDHKYNVSFSFNRVCLKRCHQAVAAAADPLFQNFLFPDQKSKIIWLDHSPRIVPSHRNLNKRQLSAVNIISRLKVSPPFLVEGPLSVVSTTKRLSNTKSVHEKELSETGIVIRESVLQILRTWKDCRILVNAPTNSLCDVLMRSLKKEIPESEMFRANAAFRELDGVPYDILPLCPFKGECFTCPPVQELRKFKVVLSTFVSSFRLHNEGITAGHFTHVFLVDASSTTEPEAMVSLANLVDEKTLVVVAGATGNSSGWVRSDIARRRGLKKSYFERLLEAEPYCSPDSEFVARIREKGADLNSYWKKSGNTNRY